MAEAKFRLPTYKYVLKRNGMVVYHGFTTNLENKWRQHQRRWPGTEIEQVGEPTTHTEAYIWSNKYQKGTDPRD